MKEKLCPDCKLVKSVSEFYTKKNPRWESERYDSYCKPCSLKRRKAWYEKGGREKVLANANKWRLENPELAKEKHRKWNWDSKMKAVNHYGGKCVCCGEDEAGGILSGNTWKIALAVLLLILLFIFLRR